MKTNELDEIFRDVSDDALIMLKAVFSLPGVNEALSKYIAQHNADLKARLIKRTACIFKHKKPRKDCSQCFVATQTVANLEQIFKEGK